MTATEVSGVSHASISLQVNLATPRGHESHYFTHYAHALQPEEAVELCRKGIMDQVLVAHAAARIDRSRDEDGNRLYYDGDEITGDDECGAVVDRNGYLWAELATGEDRGNSWWIRLQADFIETRDWDQLDFPVRAASPTWSAGG